MKINGLGTIAVPVTEKKKDKAKEKVRIGGSKDSVSSSSGDTVEVGDHAETLKLIRDLVSQNPDIRMDEVERLTKELRSKKYKINFEAVAEGFIKEAILTEISRKPRA